MQNQRKLKAMELMDFDKYDLLEYVIKYALWNVQALAFHLFKLFCNRQNPRVLLYKKLLPSFQTLTLFLFLIIHSYTVQLPSSHFNSLSLHLYKSSTIPPSSLSLSHTIHSPGPFIKGYSSNSSNGFSKSIPPVQDDSTNSSFTPKSSSLVITLHPDLAKTPQISHSFPFPSKCQILGLETSSNVCQIRLPKTPFAISPLHLI